MMRDPARLLFLCFLRASAAVTRSDIAVSANLLTLPENYTPRFYEEHLASWPQLALVAEHSPGDGQEEPLVVGYVLGRVDEEYQHEYISSSSSARPGRISSRRSLTVGHVTSLAVLPAFRKCGVGQSLMLSLQQQMSRCHSACRVNLHVRVSNLAAIRLYDALGYKTRHVVKAYYQDGEDAYLMQASLPAEESELPMSDLARSNLGAAMEGHLADMGMLPQQMGQQLLLKRGGPVALHSTKTQTRP